MLKQKNRLLLFVIPYFICSCTFLEFRDIDISFNISENQRFFEEQYIDVDFSYTPNTTDNEQDFVLKENQKVINTDIIWNSDSCSIKPKEGWKKGCTYDFTIKGNILTKTNGTYQVDYTRHFIYGNEHEQFYLLNTSIDENTVFENKLPITYTFNKPVKQYTFLTNFKLSPSIDYETTFVDNTIIITPLEKWPVNTFFEWSFENVTSYDDYYINKDNKGSFKSFQDLDIPYIESTDVVSIYNETYTWLNRDLSEIVNDQGIGLVFSRPMDYNSLQNALTFSPSLKGSLVKVDGSEDTKFIFIPSSYYKIDTLYKMQISTNAKDKVGHALKSEVSKLFKSANQFITIKKIDAEHYDPESQDIEIYDGTDSNIINSVTIPDDGNIVIVIEFSTPIEPEFKNTADATKVNISLDFPNTANNPKLTNIHWNESDNKMLLTVEDLSKGSSDKPIYYKISITGGEDGIRNESGEYMKEQLCVRFITN